MSLLSELSDFLCTVPSSGGERLCAGGTFINPALLYFPTGDPTLEATVGENQGRIAFHLRDEASLSSQFNHPRARTEEFFACFRSAPPYNLPTYDSESEVRHHGTGEHVTTQGTQGLGSGDMTRKVRRPTCTDCNREFVRLQEFKRHLKDKHGPRRQCPFCDFRWTRPNNIKVHLLARHRGKFTPELLITIRALRGKMIVAFLDGYDHGSNVEVFSLHPEQLAWGVL